jgi:hypothetical protein
MRQYNLTLTKEQLQMIDYALEATARFSIGQPSMMVEQLIAPETQEKWDLAEQIEKLIKPVMGLSSNASYGVGKDPRVDALLDLHEVIRHHLSWERAKEESLTTGYERDWSTMMTVNYDAPHHWSKSIPLATLESVSEYICFDEDFREELIREDIALKLQEHVQVFPRPKEMLRPTYHDKKGRKILEYITIGCWFEKIVLDKNFDYESSKELKPFFSDIFFVCKDFDYKDTMTFTVPVSEDISVVRLVALLKAYGKWDEDLLSKKIKELYKI